MTFVEINGGFVAASNGHMVVIINSSNAIGPELAEFLEGKYIQADAYKYLYDRSKKGCVITVDEENDQINVLIDEDEKHVISVFDIASLENRCGSKFPDWRKLWNTAYESVSSDGASMWFKMSPTLRSDIYSIMGSPTGGVTIRSSSPEKEILISSDAGDYGECYAILMPIMSFDTGQTDLFPFIQVPPNPKF
jgi:hypothetical protein